MAANTMPPGHPPGVSQALSTQFIRITLVLGCTGVELRDQVETQLCTYGDPLRWAITSVDGTIAQVEAVVTVTPNQL
ncbi:MAG: hypothetical protein AAFN42_21380 [Cyanobacteria bacterium J06554_1]